MIDADRITRVIAQRCPELTLTDLAAVNSCCNPKKRFLSSKSSTPEGSTRSLF